MKTDMINSAKELFKDLSSEELMKKKDDFEFLIKDFGDSENEEDIEIVEMSKSGIEAIEEIIKEKEAEKAPKSEAKPKEKAPKSEAKPKKEKAPKSEAKPKGKGKRGRELKLDVGDLVLEKNDPTIVGIVRGIAYVPGETSAINVDFGDSQATVEFKVSDLARYNKYKFKDAKFKPAIEKELKDSGHPAFKEKQKRGRKAKDRKEYKIEVAGKVFVFNDQKSADECEEAIKTAKKGINLAEAISEKKEDDSEAIKEGMEKASKVPVAQKITESFVGIAKKAVAEIPESKIQSDPREIKSALNELDKAFNNLFNALERVIGKQIGTEQRQQIMGILNSFEAKLEKKEDGGIIWSDDSWGKDNGWSYASFL